MNPQEQRIAIVAIAEACGFSRHYEWMRDAEIEVLCSRGIWITKEGTHCYFGTLPDYLNDLNAMHEAEKVVLHPTQTWIDYCRNLAAAVDCDCMNGCDCKHATAAQRAEAFLKTIGKWVEQNPAGTKSPNLNTNMERNLK